MRSITLTLLACALALPLGANTAQAASDEYQAGLAAAGEHRYAQALAHFQAAAAQGDRDAQRASGLMLLYGQRLYGGDIHEDRPQAMRWLRAAAAGGCEISASMLQHLTQ